MPEKVSFVQELLAAEEAEWETAGEFGPRTRALMKKVAGKRSMDHAVLAAIARLAEDDEGGFSNRNEALFYYIEALVRAGRIPRARRLIPRLNRIEDGLNLWHYIACVTHQSRDIQMVRRLLKQFARRVENEAFDKYVNLFRITHEECDLEEARKLARPNVGRLYGLSEWCTIAECSEETSDLKTVITCFNAIKGPKDRKEQLSSLIDTLVSWPDYSTALVCAGEIADESCRHEAQRTARRHWPIPAHTTAAGMSRYLRREDLEQ